MLAVARVRTPWWRRWSAVARYWWWRAAAWVGYWPRPRPLASKSLNDACAAAVAFADEVMQGRGQSARPRPRAAADRAPRFRRSNAALKGKDKKMRSLHDMARRAHVPGVKYVEVREVNSPTPGVFLSTPHFEVMVEVDLGSDPETVRANVARTVSARAREVGDGAVYDVRLIARSGS